MLPRFDAMLKPELTRLRHLVSTYLRENFHYTQDDRWICDLAADSASLPRARRLA
jgi:hypothetical protein